ncbi:low temperature requirement protein A [Rugosimonospora africana]|uniref:Low temperature requirement protein LtrA n=1 Tax=Rugosimonospora africana TaxID=556532 RepID=A0A8J3QYT7_9ACTN|nr:low temperature requirement protein A [Rugosimonospora africana]GIH18572.1 hypothetical protein Raf01_67440 [Rugosimonospora africana]
MAEPAGRRRSLTHSYGETRRSSWLELFFDLVFVVAVFRLGRLLVDDPSLHGVLVFAGLLTTVWWLWISFSYFADLFDDDRPPSRLVQLVAMLGVLALSTSLGGVAAGNSGRFAVAYGLLLLLLLGMYAVVGWLDEQVREFCRWFVLGYLVGAAAWFGSLLVPTPARYAVWGAALVVNAAVSGPVAYARVSSLPTQESHMPERFGLFTIVVLGEAVLALANAIDATGWRPSTMAIGTGGFVIASGVWWVYFITAFHRGEANRALRAGRRATLRSFLYGYGHLAVYGAIAALGVAVELAAREAAHHERGVSGPLLGGSQLALVLGGLILYLGLNRPVSRRVASAHGALAVVALVIALGGLPPLVAVSLSVAIWVIVVVVEQAAASAQDG